MKRFVVWLYGAFLITAGIFMSCDRNEELVEVPQSKVTSVASPSSTRALRSFGSIHEVWLETRNVLQHYCQRNAGKKSSSYPEAEGVVSSSMASSLCLPTSYMMAAYALAEVYGEDFSLSGAHLSSIQKQLGSNYRSLRNLHNQLSAGKVDGSSFLVSERCSTGDRADMKSFIENALDRNMLVLVAVRADVYDYDKINTFTYNRILTLPNQDRNPDMAYGSDHYILTKSANDKGHIILLVEMSIWGTGNGCVSYLDPLARTRTCSPDEVNNPSYALHGSYWNNERYVLYSRLLDSMLANSADGTYNAVAIGHR